MIKIQNLSKKFQDRPIFSRLNLNFQPGKVYALIGESGSGKTTLLNILANLEDYDSGDVYYNDKSLKSFKSHDYFRNYLGYLFQNYGLIESDSIKENLDLGLVGRKLSKSDRVRLQQDALDRVGLDYLKLDQKIYTISGGEAQRVALAKTIIKDPPLILADEPTASLDPDNSRDVMELLLSLKNDSRIIIIATHNPNVWQMADERVDLNKIK